MGLETPYGGQLTLSTQFLKPNNLAIPLTDAALQSLYKLTPFIYIVCIYYYLYGN